MTSAMSVAPRVSCTRNCTHCKTSRQGTCMALYSSYVPTEFRRRLTLAPATLAVNSRAM